MASKNTLSTSAPLAVLKPSQATIEANFARSPARDLPVTHWSEWQSVTAVKNAIRGLELGMFDASSQVVDAMMRDDRIGGCLLKRTEMLPSLPISFEPRGDGRMKKKVASDVEEHFETWFPDYALAELHHWGIMQGIGVGQLLWTTDSKWTPFLKVWHPRFITYRQDTRSLWVQTVEGQKEIVPGDGQWVIFAPHGIQRGWMYSLVRRLFVPWLIRQWGMRDWARYSEVHGMPFRKAKTPTNASREDEERFLREVALIGTESVIRTPSTVMPGGEIDRFDLELVEAVGRSEEGFDKLLRMASDAVSIAICGQNLTSDVKGGSYAAAKVHTEIEQGIIQSDAGKLAQCIREQALRPYALVNYGSMELAPLPIWKTKPAEDQKVKGEGLKALGEGIAQLKRIGAKPDVNKLLEQAEVPVTGSAEEVDINALEHPVIENRGDAAAPGRGGRAPQRPSSSPRKVAQASRAQLAQEDELPEELVEGQLYVDEVAEQGADAAVKVLKPDVKALLSLIEQAESYDDIRKGLIKLYAGLSRKELAKLLKHTVQLADMAGRYAAREERGEGEVDDEADGT